MVKLCEICKETVSIGECPICTRNVCRYCSITLKCSANPNGYYFEFRKIGKKAKPTVIICKKCLKKLAKFWANADEKEKDLLAEKFFELLIKLTTIEKMG